MNTIVIQFATRIRSLLSEFFGTFFLWMNSTIIVFAVISALTCWIISHFKSSLHQIMDEHKLLKHVTLPTYLNTTKLYNFSAFEQKTVTNATRPFSQIRHSRCPIRTVISWARVHDTAPMTRIVTASYRLTWLKWSTNTRQITVRSLSWFLLLLLSLC